MQKHAKIITFIVLLAGLFSTLAFAKPTLASVETHVSNSILQTTPAPSPSPDEVTSSGPPLSMTISLLCFCLAFSLVIGVFVLGFIVRMPSREDREKYKEKEKHGIL
jgi:hypothetical protein